METSASVEHEVRIGNFNSVAVDLLGRFMCEDRQEYPCRIDSMSPAAMSVIAVIRPREGERVIAYIDHLGRLEGTVLEVLPDGFQVRLNTTGRKREKLAAQLTWFANRHTLDLPEDRRHDRVTPKNSSAQLRLETGEIMQVRIIDLSLSGAAVATSVRPSIGSAVTLGPVRGRVVRHLDAGFAIEFASLQSETILASVF